MFKLNPVPLHRFQQGLLFILFWEKFSGALSFGAGILLFLVFSMAGLLIEAILRKAFSDLPGYVVPVGAHLLLLLVFPCLHLLDFLFLNHPGALAILSFHNILQPVLPWVILFRLLLLVSSGGGTLNLGVLAIYAAILTLLMSRHGWMIELPFEQLPIAYLMLYLFILNGILLILSGGTRGRRLGWGPLLILILIPSLILIPISRNYSSESKRESGGLLESSLFRFDFSNYLSLESSISMKDDLVFMMKKDGPESDFMIRRFILPEYSLQKGFFRTSGPTLESPGQEVDEYLLGEVNRSWDIPVYSLSEEVSQEYYLVNFDSSAFLGLNTPESVTPFLSWDHSSFSRIYRVESQVSTAWGWDLMAAKAPEPVDSESRKFLDYYTNYGGQEDLRETAERIVSGLEGYYDKAEAIESYLKYNYFYSLHPGTADDGDQLRHFLYASQKGYCSYFAFSMALLCRSVGIPARVALGFWVDGSSGVLNYYPVKANQAHAWVEVYFPDFGWIEFDPTSQTPAPGEEYLFAPLSAQEIEPYLREILENRDSLKAAKSPDPSLSGDERSGSRRLPGLTSVPGMMAEIIILLLVVPVFRTIRRVLLLKHVPGNAGRAAGYFHFHLRMTESLLQPRMEGESPQNFGRRLSSSVPELADFIILYEKIRFGWSSLSDLEALYHSGRILREQIRKEQGRAGWMKFFKFLVLGRL